MLSSCGVARLGIQCHPGEGGRRCYLLSSQGGVFRSPGLRQCAWLGIDRENGHRILTSLTSSVSSAAALLSQCLKYSSLAALAASLSLARRAARPPRASEDFL